MFSVHAQIENTKYNLSFLTVCFTVVPSSRRLSTDRKLKLYRCEKPFPTNVHLDAMLFSTSNTSLRGWKVFSASAEASSEDLPVRAVTSRLSITLVPVESSSDQKTGKSDTSLGAKELCFSCYNPPSQNSADQSNLSLEYDATLDHVLHSTLAHRYHPLTPPPIHPTNSPLHGNFYPRSISPCSHAVRICHPSSPPTAFLKPRRPLHHLPLSLFFRPFHARKPTLERRTHTHRSSRLLCGLRVPR